ncbi:phosphoenolpyruvate carboxykinase (ATP) [Mangrovimonas sp. AS39]|uniref:phosphoenolpyruvate carboxykinase (ATP) n=1 Tax=Mangrovimonas TaxID=1211036 RepID=UPI0006B60A41|nr:MULTISPECIES: phosphoenolpyruvate carboxykinase (ATP) [Mangrovimonas]MCF1190492.1 phosphoenolpyruvate carboxykinase (ATP) [Mangrovimonas futianensis]MCF1193756.1 phosphoenolpyruvate carboxykinase (ATP) [Mangrovimonas futianensis]NIK91039.1 phosphoenolpyruvate carboxykinase (ATP) [Mangrovimonas sp. CR14]
MGTLVEAERNLEKYGLKDTVVHWNLSPESLQKITVEKGMGQETANGTLAVNTGKFTGRSPQDRFLVQDEYTKDKIWWGKINKPISPENFNKLKDEVVEYLSGKEIYARDGYVCADPEYKLNVRTVTEFPWSNLFVNNMFLRLSEEELETFEEDWLVLCAPGYVAPDPEAVGLRQGNFSIINFTDKIALVGGSAYTGEMKKGIFTALNLILPVERNVLPMHCSANVGEEGDTAIFFGLSGTGKTTLSADPNRKLIGDDEHGWTANNSIFNFEGGCYAKVIDLTEEKEPDIFRAIRPGALLENVIINNGEVDFEDSTITQNTRVSYPIEHIDNIQVPSYADNPKNIFFLTCDAFGVLPPVSKLTPGQAAYHFISGYTAKVAGTEAGITEPVPSFSACFGAPFMPLHPTAYAEMLSAKMQEAGVNVWLINTGWSGGPYGVGSRIKLKYTRAMISAILNGELDNVDFEQHPIFGLFMPKYCPGVPTEILDPMNTWLQKGAYISKAIGLAHSFHLNFEKFASQASAQIMEGGPLIDEHHQLADTI